MDHSVPTKNRHLPLTDDVAAAQMDALARNCRENGILFLTCRAQSGIVHVIGPELGITQPGLTIVCGDSHTSTHGALGALAFASAPAKSNTCSLRSAWCSQVENHAGAG